MIRTSESKPPPGALGMMKSMFRKGYPESARNVAASEATAIPEKPRRVI
jgi:hypothetical protein